MGPYGSFGLKWHLQSLPRRSFWIHSNHAWVLLMIYHNESFCSCGKSASLASHHYCPSRNQLFSVSKSPAMHLILAIHLYSSCYSNGDLDSYFSLDRPDSFMLLRLNRLIPPPLYQNCRSLNSFEQEERQMDLTRNI